MSVLINVIGFAVTSAVIALGVKSTYEASQIDEGEDDESEEDYIEEVSPIKQNLTAEVLGLTVEIAKYGLESADRKVDVIFDNPIAKWIKWQTIERFQLEPDGFYFKSRAEQEWNGYYAEQDVPVYKAGKFEMYI
jgi:hypothetical protein